MSSCPDMLKYVPRAPPREVTAEDFELGEFLGKGTFGLVHVARDRLTNGLVALKKISIKEIVEANMKEQLVRELKVMQRLSHPNVLRLYTYFVEANHIVLVVEYAPKGDVYSLLTNEKQLSLRKTAKFVAQLTAACSYAHKHGVVHRDIKPENLLLDINGNLKLADFGWSAFITASGTRGTYCGTPDYIPPEMESREKYGFTVDNWCIGVFAYECLFGDPPFDSSDDVTRAKKILAQEYSFPPKPVLPEEAYDLIRNLLTGDPERRLSLDDILSHPFIVKYA